MLGDGNVATHAGYAVEIFGKATGKYHQDASGNPEPRGTICQKRALSVVYYLLADAGRKRGASGGLFESTPELCRVKAKALFPVADKDRRVFPVPDAKTIGLEHALFLL